jgi:hypothetical protein
MPYILSWFESYRIIILRKCEHFLPWGGELGMLFSIVIIIVIIRAPYCSLSDISDSLHFGYFAENILVTVFEFGICTPMFIAALFTIAKL